MSENAKCFAFVDPVELRSTDAAILPAGKITVP
jgi:hypothetical protein